MRILIISNTLPFPITTGGDQAVVNMINSLQYKCETHFLYKANRKKDDIDATKKHWSKVIFHPFTESRSISFYLSRIAIHYAHNYQHNKTDNGCLITPFSYYTKNFIKYIQITISSISPNIVQCEFYPNLDLVYALPKNIKKVYIQHEVHYTINEQRRNSEQNWGNFQDFAIAKLKADEIMAMNQYNAVFTLTKADCESLKKDGVSTLLFDSPVGIEKPRYRNACRFDNKLIFVGTGAHSPNVDGIMWFLNHVWPAVIKKHQDIKLNIIGKWNSEQISRLSQYKNVIFKGFVSSLQEEYDGAIAIVPILRGSGLRMKIIDAVNYGSCFISTSIGANDMHFEDNRDCFIADEPELFAKKLNCLINNADIRQTFYSNSEKIVTEYYSVEQLVTKRFVLYQKLLNE